MTGVSRRFVLGGLAAGVGVSTWPRDLWAASSADLVAASGLSGDVGFVVADLRTGQVLESRAAGRAMPPASALKSITSLYAIDRLGTDFRFGTHLIATGPVAGGVIQGDLVLAGGGDPTLSTDDLNAMAAALADKGVKGVTGRFLTWSGALPYARQIADDQTVEAGYNPAISGLMLNYDRVHFSWKRAKGGWILEMDARGRNVQPRAYTVGIGVVARGRPRFTYADRGGKEHWTVASEALGRGGSRWLPVRDPEAYAGDVFQTLARAQGTPLPSPQPVRQLPGGTVLAQHASDDLRPLLRAMMKYSTNLTAEAVGQMASAQAGQGGSMAASGRAMADWLSAKIGTNSVRFTDHSGLRSDARIAPEDMVSALRSLGAPMGLRALMKPFKLRDANGKPMKSQPFTVDAKTGTLNFVSTLAGYMTAPDGTELVFAIFTGDLARRARVAGQSDPPGVREWVRRSKILQSQLLQRWATLYG